MLHSAVGGGDTTPIGTSVGLVASDPGLENDSFFTAVIGVEVTGCGIEPAILVTADLGGLDTEATVVPVGICGWELGKSGVGPTSG